MVLSKSFAPLLVLVLAVAPAFGQSTIQLSDFVSDGATPPPVEDLSGSMTFDLSANSLPATLLLTVDNQTDENVSGDQYRINEVFFNIPDNADVIGISLLSIDGGSTDGWTLGFDAMINGYGDFDVSLIDGQGQSPEQIFPGTAKTFELLLDGTGSLTDLDLAHFTNLTSGIGNPNVTVAAKFVDSNNESGFGASLGIPEPATLALLALGGLLMVKRRR